MHPPLLKSQHAPNGHGLGAHAVAAGDASTVPAGHAVLAGTTLHCPSVGLQQALGPHGFGAQVEPSP